MIFNRQYNIFTYKFTSGDKNLIMDGYTAAQAVIGILLASTR